MPESLPNLETELAEARRDLQDAVAGIKEKVAAVQAQLSAPAKVIGIGVAAMLGFVIGSRKSHAPDPVVILAAGYCGAVILRRTSRRGTQ
jgi:DNA segregation ATPase FtsK/SpoIIIE-like protein